MLKVKEPIAAEYRRLRADQVLFTYLHLAADRACTQALLDAGITALGYETVQLPDGSLPLLAPMSEVAGRMAPQVGAKFLERFAGGRGVLLGGVPGVQAGKVVVLGAGVAGMNAAVIALGMQAEVLLLDKNIAKLREADRIYQGHCQTLASNRAHVEQSVADADLVDRRRAGARGAGAEAGDRRDGCRDEARVGARGHQRRPGRLLRVHPAHDTFPAGLPGARFALLLCDQHAGGGAVHVDLRADQRHASLRPRAWRPGRARCLRGRSLAGAAG